MPPTAVIVGHGLSPKGKGWGAKIDNCDTVVRMWNWHWQNKFDYGTKYDYGFFEINSAEMARYHRHNVCKPARGWVATTLHSNVGRKEYTGEFPFPTEIVSSEEWEAEGRRLGGMGLKGRLVLSRGVRAAAWALYWLPKGHRLVLVGFDNVYKQRALPITEGYPPEFVDCPACFPFRDYTGGGTKYGNHDYAVEGPLLRAIAAKREVTLLHAQDLWP